MKLSVISINYNNAAGLEKTITSIIPYRSAEVEYIVIDGGSTDGSSALLEKFDGQIDYHISAPDKGVFHAMNKGTEQARGKYLLFMNSGDIIKDDVDFNKILPYLNGEDLICFDIEMAYAVGGHFINTSPSHPDFKFFAEQSLPHQASFIMRETLMAYGGYNEDMKLAADWAFTLDALCLNGYTYKYIHDHFSVYYLDGMSSRNENHSLLWEEKRQYIEKKYPLYYSLYKEWLEKKDELYRLKTSVSVRTLKKLGFLKWLK